MNYDDDLFGCQGESEINLEDVWHSAWLTAASITGAKERDCAHFADKEVEAAIKDAISERGRE